MVSMEKLKIEGITWSGTSSWYTMGDQKISGNLALKKYQNTKLLFFILLLFVLLRKPAARRSKMGCFWSN
jgi:hypothetical protein